MNKRQTEKHYKNKWKCVLCKIFNDNMGLKVKPSRMKLRIYEDGDNYGFVGGFSGYSFKLDGVRLKDGRTDNNS